MENSRFEQPLVSVVCDTYNQKAFIGQALDSFLTQRTTFPVEIIVHDDASTDGTADIVRDYERRFPDRFRNVYRTENMYDHDPKILEHHVFPLARGKYIAICEGDDYWTSPDKLQRQIDYMEANPSCTLCIHAAALIDADGNRIGSLHPTDGDGTVPTETVIRGMGGFCPTASIVAPTHLAQNRAPFCDLTDVDDLPLQIFFASRGATYCIDEELCAYRVNAPGSWSVQQRAERVEKRVALQQKNIRMHEAFDNDTDYRYHEAVLDAIRKDNFEIHWLRRDVKSMRQKEFLAMYRALPLKTRLKLNLGYYLPFLKGGRSAQA